MKTSFYNISAILLLGLMAVISVISVLGDSLTMDELAHLPAGYSYLVKQDMRLNPEHPPLMKDLAGFPLLFIKGINFPENAKSWKQDINGQWDFGREFLFRSNNPAEEMIFWGRMPMILVLIIGGIYTYLLGRDFFGEKVGLLALFLYSFSPTFLAHGRYVTTDVPMATGIIIAFYYFLKFIYKPNTKNTIFSGLSFGLALLLKFNGVFLAPCFIFLSVLWAVLKARNSEEPRKVIFHYAKSLFFVFFIAGLLIYPVYAFHTLNYPIEMQIRDMDMILPTNPVKQIHGLLMPIAKIGILRPYAQYLFGLAMVLQRGIGGNTTYFMGEVSRSGWKTYFPLLYLFKETLTLHILTILGGIGVFFIIKSHIKKAFKKPNNRFFKNLLEILETRFSRFVLLSFILLYIAITLAGNLNIGVRHLLPIFSLIFILVSRDIMVCCMREPFLKLRYGILACLLVWQIVSVALVFPHFLTYYNEAVGGPSKGYLIAADSNLDWGQDVKRLKTWAEENGINKIYLDIFGGVDLPYYFGNNYESWWGTRDRNEIESGSYLAVSATFRQGGRGAPAHGFDENTSFYNWLDEEELVKTIGNSIFIYRIR